MNSSTPDTNRGTAMASITFACASCAGRWRIRSRGSVRCHDCIETQAPVQEACVAALRRPPRELDRREDDGIAVTLLWYEDTNRVAVGVVDRRSGEVFEL